MFDPDGDQAAADSTRSSTSLDTGSSLNPRTARRLVTASYTSIMIASLPLAILFVQTHAVVSFGLTQQAVSTPSGPVPNERRRRRPPHGRRTGTTGEWPPAPRRSPPAPVKVRPGRGPPPRGRVRSRC